MTRYKKHKREPKEEMPTSLVGAVTEWTANRGLPPIYPTQFLSKKKGKLPKAFKRYIAE